MKYYVSPHGNDHNNGSLENPFQTLAHAVKNLHPGDECILRGGTYREVLRPTVSGEPDRPIRFCAFESEHPILSAGDVLDNWTDEGDDIWSTMLPIDLGDGNQLFAGERMLSEARWPKHNGDLFSPSRASATDGTGATLTDPNLPGDKDAWTGATLWCAGGAKWICWAGSVTGFDTTSHTLTFTSEQSQKNFYVVCEGSEYVLMGTRGALTDPGEWWFDRDSGRLYLEMEPGRAPAENMEAKVRKTVIDLRGISEVHLEGLSFRGGGLRTDSYSRRIRLEKLHGEYVAHSFVRDVSEDAIYIDGSDHVIVDCDFGYSSGSVLKLAGCHHKLLGNHIHHGNYGGLWRGTVSLSGRRHVFAHNTVRHSGRDLLSVHGLSESLIEYNDLSYAGWLTHDLGITYGHNTDFGGTIIRRNLVHDCVALGLAEGIYFDHCSHNVVVYENLIWNIPGMPIQVNNPGHFNLIAHNSCFNSNIARASITSFDHSHRQDLFGSHFLNNLTNGPFELTENAHVAGNVVSKDPGYIDPENFDFRLNDQYMNTVAPTEISGLYDEVSTLPGAFQKGQRRWPAGRIEGTPVDESVEWIRPSWRYTNRIVNAAFEIGSTEGWNVTGDGSAGVVSGNGWGNEVSGTGDAPTGTSFYELALLGSCRIEQVVVGVPGDTRMFLSAWVRADSEVPVILEITGPEQRTYKTSSSSVEWTRVNIEYTSGPVAEQVTVSVYMQTHDTAARGRVDNIGFIEAD